MYVAGRYLPVPYFKPYVVIRVLEMTITYTMQICKYTT